jgi:hypothetical protein
LIEIPPETRETSAQLWDSLLAMEALKTGYNEFGKYLRGATLPKEEPEPKVPF